MYFFLKMIILKCNNINVVHSTLVLRVIIKDILCLKNVKIK